MAEAVAAFALAANVLQVVEFGSKFVSNLWRVYRGIKQGSSLSTELEELTQSLKENVEDLRKNQNSAHELGPQFHKLITSCSDVASELLNSITSIKSAEKDGSKLGALHTALKSVWKEDDLRRLQSRLDSFRSELMLHLISNLRLQARKSEQQQSLILENIYQVLESTKAIQNQQGKRLNVTGRQQITSEDALTTNDQQSHVDELGSRMLDMIVSRLPHSTRFEGKELLEQQAISSLLQINDFSDNPIISSQRYEQLTRRMLVRLRYTAMQDRAENIVDAHAKTFSWIFDHEEMHQWTKLSEWLISDDQLYWVTGKAGSGKSTLMKFICYHDAENAMRCMPYLQRWAPPPLRLVVVSHFFWNSGTSLQMTHLGLLRSLLYQLLSKIPSLIPKASPARWEALCLFGADNTPKWTLDELVTMLRSAMTHLEDDMRICLFIDGLDEFDGDHSILVHLCKELSNNPKVKICVSSRPWEVFAQAFEQQPSLRMEDLTRNDISSYVIAELAAAPDYAALQQREPSYANQLVANIVEKASGVFLWVHLVVNSLVAGMSHGDRVADLQRRLDLLPPELEHLYDKMLKSLDPFYLEHAAQLFTYVRVANEPPSLLLLTLIDEETCDSVIENTAHAMTAGAVHLRCDNMRRRINSRTKGLLEVTRLSGELLGKQTVQYLHRTVHDYMESPTVKDELQKVLTRPTEIMLQMCVGVLGFLKYAVLEFWVDFQSNRTKLLMKQFIMFAASIQTSHRTDMLRLCDELLSIVPAEDTAPEKQVGIGSPFHMLYHANIYRLAVEFELHEFLVARPVEGYLVTTFRNDPLDRSVYRKFEHHSLVSDALGMARQDDNPCFRERGWSPNVRMLSGMIQNGARVGPWYEAICWTTREQQKGINVVCQDPILLFAEQFHNIKLTSSSKIAWIGVLEQLIAHNDQFWPVQQLKSWSRLAKEHYHEGLMRLGDDLCPGTRLDQSVGRRIKRGILSHSALVKLSSSGYAKQIHRDRLHLLQVLKASLEDFEVVE